MESSDAAYPRDGAGGATGQCAGPRWDLLFVWLLIAAYFLTFGAISILQNEAFSTTVHDLGVMDQAAWNTLHGRFVMESSQEGRSLSRLRGHVEPIFLLISLVYLLYDHVDALLLLQAAVIAVGALPAYWLARDAAGRAGQRLSRLTGLALAAAYLLLPQLEAANLTEFHPVALVPPFMLFAFHYARQNRWSRYALFGLLALSCKEDVSLTMVGLGAYLVAASLWRRRTVNGEAREAATAGFWWGLATMSVAAAWFFVSLYVVVPRFSSTGGYPLFDRYAELGGGPAAVLRTAFSRPGELLEMLVQPARAAYVTGLLSGTGFLTLLSPATLVLALPSLAINLLSNYPVMYSGVSHYSAPVVPWIIVSAALGLSVLHAVGARFSARLGQIALVGGVVWLLAWSFGYHASYGFTPLGGRFHFPVVTDHHRLAQRFLDQIPAGARLSTQPALFPHASHRESIYEYPIVADAEYIWLDVTSSVGMHPNDFREAFNRLVGDGQFGIADAADGYILLKRGQSAPAGLPGDFYSFARSGGQTPQLPLNVQFGDSLKLVGLDLYEVLEDGKPWTGLRTYWQALAPLPDGFTLHPFFFDDWGKVVEDTSQRPIVTALWFPPAMWRPGETVVMEKLPWPIGDRFSLGIGVTAGGDWSRPDARLAVRQAPTGATPPEQGLMPVAGDGTWAHVATLSRVDGRLVAQSPARRFAAPPMLRTVGFRLGDSITLLGYDVSGSGRQATVTLYWRALAPVRPSYTVFLHLLDAAGRGVGQVDGLPAAGVRPTNTWAAGEIIADRRTVSLDAAAAAGEYRLAAGLYQLETLQRLPVVDASGRPSGDSADLGTVLLGN